jgi:hypothetical protein
MSPLRNAFTVSSEVAFDWLVPRPKSPPVAAEDRLAPFLEEKTGASKSGQVPKGLFYSVYKEWAELAGERPMSKRALGTRMDEKGFAPNDKNIAGVRVWNGIFLVDRGEE